MTDRLQPGIKHAPGVLCIVKERPDNQFPTLDNRQVVEITRRLTTGMAWRCQCGAAFVAIMGCTDHTWEVKGNLHCVSRFGLRIVPVTIRVFDQTDLIPIGGKGLLADEQSKVAVKDPTTAYTGLAKQFTIADINKFEEELRKHYS